MSIKSRLMIIVNLLLFIAIAIGFISVVYTSKNAVRSEIESSMHLAEFSIESGIKKNPDLYLFQDNLLGLSQLKSLRHLSIRLLDINGQVVDENRAVRSESPSPIWFQNVLNFYSKELRQTEIKLKKFGEVVGAVNIIPNPVYEYDEIWQQIKNGLIIAAIFFLMVNISIYFLFEKLISPINQIILGFQSLEQGKYVKNNKSFGIPELDLLRLKYNQLTAKLKKNDRSIHLLTTKLMEVQEVEKKEIARNLHDEIGQSLAAIQVEATSAQTVSSFKESKKHTSVIIQTTKELMDLTRNIIKRLSLGIVDDLGLEDALIDLVSAWEKQNNKVVVIKKINITHQKYSNKARESVYRCIQESLTNINKHSRPTHVSVTIEETKSTLSIWIKNNGILKNKSLTQGVGLLGMLERISSIKGTLNFFQRADSFNLKIQIPIR